MDNTKTFKYSYSAKDNEEILRIRNKYMPQKESKLDELKRLDGKVGASGTTEALCVGIGGSLIFGLGFCMTAGIIGNGILFTVTGALLCIIGIIGMLSAYFVYRSVFRKTKAKLAPRILELTDELSKEKNIC